MWHNVYCVFSASWKNNGVHRTLIHTWIICLRNLRSKSFAETMTFNGSSLQIDRSIWAVLKLRKNAQTISKHGNMQFYHTEEINLTEFTAINFVMGRGLVAIVNVTSHVILIGKVITSCQTLRNALGLWRLPSPTQLFRTPPGFNVIMQTNVLPQPLNVLS